MFVSRVVIVSQGVQFVSDRDGHRLLVGSRAIGSRVEGSYITYLHSYRVTCHVGFSEVV